MGAFFVVFFGLLFLCGGLFREKINSISTSISEEKYNEINNKITNSGCEYTTYPGCSKSYAKGDKVFSAYISGSTEEHWDMIKDVHEELRYVLGENWKGILEEYYCDNQKGFKFFNDQGDGFHNVWYMAWEISLSKKGFIPHTRPWRGYDLYEPIYGIDRGNQQMVASKACRVILKNINERHPGLNLRLNYIKMYKESKLCWSHWIERTGSEIHCGSFYC